MALWGSVFSRISRISGFSGFSRFLVLLGIVEYLENLWKNLVLWLSGQKIPALWGSGRKGSGREGGKKKVQGGKLIFSKILLVFEKF